MFRVAARYDKLAANHLAFIQLASIGLWQRVHASARCPKNCTGIAPRAIRAMMGPRGGGIRAQHHDVGRSLRKTSN
jgi:hypothetical protein